MPPWMPTRVARLHRQRNNRCAILLFQYAIDMSRATGESHEISTFFCGNCFAPAHCLPPRLRDENQLCRSIRHGSAYQGGSADHSDFAEYQLCERRRRRNYSIRLRRPGICLALSGCTDGKGIRSQRSGTARHTGPFGTRLRFSRSAVYRRRAINRSLAGPA